MSHTLDRLAQKLHVGRTLLEAGIIAPTRPDRLYATGRALVRWGPSPTAGYISGAARFPDRPAIVDEAGTLTYGEVHRRTNALASALSDRGINEGDGVAVMCRNHRGYIEATVALAKIGANTLYLNTAFAGPQLTDVVQRERAAALIYDAEFANLVGGAAEGRRCFVAWHDEDEQPPHPTLDELCAAGDDSNPVPPAKAGRAVILTSGTTGAPKGAQRENPASLDPAAALLSKIPLRSGEPTMIASPLFHTWGYAHFLLGLVLGSTLVLRRRFDPEATLELTARSRATALIVVPVMLQRILELPAETIERHDTSALRTIAVSGSALPGPLATRVMDTFGDKLYNLYGSTEVAWATIATPEDMRAAPGTAGRPPRGTIVRLYDENGRAVPRGQTGRIFVGNDMPFEGYSGGGGKAMIDGLMATGDVGHFDAGGRLFVDGRDDDMIVSGGENVFPAEVEDLLAGHEAVREVAVIGVEDEKFGQRLKAYIALNPGAELTAKQVKDHVKSNLAAYKVPRDVEFLDALPRNATGKVVKRDL